MQTDEKRQGVTITAKVNLTAAKTTLTATRENLAAAMSPGIKWREDKAELARYNKNLVSL